ncbi:MAG: hypothetical protein K2K04_01245, partial [Clostridia bacterium]|nr:hypothetical protein [Clostridia bacterium]
MTCNKVFTFKITKGTLATPVVEGDTLGTEDTVSKSYTYAEDYQQFVLTNMTKATDINGDPLIEYTLSEGLEVVSHTDDGRLVLKAKASKKYTVTVKLANSANLSWDMSGHPTCDKVFNFTIKFLEIDAPEKDATCAAASVNYTGNEYYYVFKNVHKIAVKYSFTGTPMEEVSWTDDGVLTLKAVDVDKYTVVFSLADSVNYRFKERTSATKTYSFIFNIIKFKHVYPLLKTSTGGTADTISLVYNGADQEIEIRNMYQVWDQYSAPAFKYISWTNENVVKLSVKNVGTYTISVSVINPNNSSWTTTNGGGNYTSKTLTVKITAKAITERYIDFVSDNSEIQTAIDNLSRTSIPTWPAGENVYAVPDLVGVYAGDKPALDVVYYISTNTSLTYALEADAEGRYLLPKKLPIGTYYVAISLSNSNGVPNYTMKKITRGFKINTAFAPFIDKESEVDSKYYNEYLQWQYTNNGKTTVAASGYGTADNPLVLEYNSYAYSFTVTKTKAELQSLGVKISSYSGDTGATKAKDGLYCAKVTIAAYNTKYFYNTKTFEFYYKINKIKIDLSNVAWNYSSPLTYTGSALNVYIKSSTLPAGLSVKEYSGDRNMVNATEGTGANYRTYVTFEVANDSYYLPDKNDSTSYIGADKFVSVSYTH